MSTKRLASSARLRTPWFSWPFRRRPRACVPWLLVFTLGALSAAGRPAIAQAQQRRVELDAPPLPGSFLLADTHTAASIYLAPEDEPLLGEAVKAFASDVEHVTGTRPLVISTLSATAGAPLPRSLVIVGIVGRTRALDQLARAGRLLTSSISGTWEQALTAVVPAPVPGVEQALVIAGSDRRGAAFALFTLSRQMGVSPWNWWADVPVTRHRSIAIAAGTAMQPSPSVAYRGIFLNDEDWGLRPWAARKMDPEVANIGPHTYARIFELLLRLHANSLWPAMHPGTLAFNALPENARLADRWGIVMGSSHSEALLRNNVGEWSEPRDGPWNYQTNHLAMDAYWEKRVKENGKFENFYTVGLRGLHDSGLEATGTAEQKARLVESAMGEQRTLLASHVGADLTRIPQVIWLYKESLELYRAGMRVPDDVTLGWTDDNYGYLRQLSTVAEQKRAGGSGVYYHVSYWGFPHDYLWLCTTPPALIREEMTKAYDHQARRYWVLNVGDIKPAEADIDYFLQLAWDEPAMAPVDQHTFLERWSAEQFPPSTAAAIADILGEYYRLNFVRKPEFMGFNGYDDGVNRTSFNPLAWGDQNRARLVAWQQLRDKADALGKTLPAVYQAAYLELVGYPVDAAAAQNEKFLATDRGFLDAAEHRDAAVRTDAQQAQAAYDRIQASTAAYNTIEDGKWDGMMSAAPRDRQVFLMPRTASPGDSAKPLPSAWSPGSTGTADERGATERSLDETGAISINAAHFSRKYDGALAQWVVLPELGISGGLVEYGSPGLLAEKALAAVPLAEAPWLEYVFSTTYSAPATLTLSLLPTFAVDAEHRLRYAVALDGGSEQELDASGSGEWHEDTAPTWAANVLRNSATATVSLGALKAGEHRLRLLYRDPGVVFEHLVVSFAGTAPAYPVPPESPVWRPQTGAK